MRAQLNEVLPKYYRVRLGICPGGSKALDLLTEIGVLRISQAMTRFVSNLALSTTDDDTSIVTTASSSPLTPV